jgi:hypothetical protein
MAIEKVRRKLYAPAFSGDIQASAGSIGTAELADDAVTAAKLDSDAVVTASIVDANVTTAKIADANVTTAKIANDAVDADKLASAAVVSASLASGIARVNRAVVAISSAELLAMFYTPKELVAPASDNYILVLGIMVTYDYSSTAYTIGDTNVDLYFSYTDESGQQIGNIETTGFIDQTSDQVRYLPAGATEITPVINAPIVCWLSQEDVTAGDGDLSVEVFYALGGTGVV